MSDESKAKNPEAAATVDTAGPGKGASLPKRFYKDVTAKDEGAGAALLLDGKPVRTPGKAPLAVPTRALAEAIAEEWRAQGERIDPRTMPLTRLANSAIDGVRGREQAVVDDIMAHARADLLCYRASGPEGLVAEQAKHWDKVIAWAKDALKAPLVLAEGVVHVTQPETSLAEIRKRVEGLDAFGLAALHVMTSLTGSAVLALAVALGRLTPDEAWQVAHVDEDWQISQWGEDAEAAARRAARRRDFDAACKALQLLERGTNPSP
ncbi:MAG: ATP12 family chaperone protein [Methyloceanibacter sp.]|uniref:ATP12 family chaperone protein n=1 Tax=Methyloceanibacter sp. TaxID=1965321 RepID=UPI003D6D324B